MKVWGFFLGLFVSVSLCLAQDDLISLATLAGEPFALEGLGKGRWALAFVVVPGCPACEKVIQWFNHAAEAFPEIRFAFVVPSATPELGQLALENMLVLIDDGGKLGLLFGVRRAPTVLLFVEGISMEKLDWPFTEELLLRKLAESLLIAFPNPTELLGNPAPDFSAQSIDGEELAFADLPKPLLLAFIFLGCAPCWGALPVLVRLSQEVPVVLVAVVGRPGISEESRGRLVQFLKQAQEAGGKAFVLLDLWVEGLSVNTAYNVRRSPTFFFVGGKGVVEGVWEGEESLERLLKEVLARLVSEKEGGEICFGEC
ncbi:redoxin domain-containing protein [Candidatus Bipolaricaulota bacterium]|nr:redoxin domain-containing protein [Candidatus Bipolaricaulota bacterium]